MRRKQAKWKGILPVPFPIDRKLRNHTCTVKTFRFSLQYCFCHRGYQKQLKIKTKNWEKIRLIQDKKKTYLLSEERYNTGATLYYIPIIPLYRLSKNPNYRQAVQLLQSVCSYLYHIADVPYYRKQESYLCWMYEMISDWLINDETEDTPEYLREIKQSEWIGDYVEQKYSIIRI